MNTLIYFRLEHFFQNTFRLRESIRNIMFFKDCRYVAALIFPDLRFEWILSVCMVFALGAIFAPLFILLGLQEGIVGNMFDQLKHDPASRLVTPKYPLKGSLNEIWLNALRQRSAIVITTPVSHLQLDIEGLEDPVNAIPTVPEDPLLTENRISLAGENRPIVLSAALAQKTGKKIGDPLTLVLVRHTGVEEKVPIRFRVTGILPKSASADVKLWLPQTFFRFFYQWRKGRAVPELGLSGTGSILNPEYDGIVTILTTVPADEEYRQMLSGRIGFSNLPQAHKDADIGWTLPPDYEIRVWRPVNTRVYPSDFKPLVNRHHELGYAVDAVPFIDDFRVDLKLDGHSQRMSVTILPDTSETDEDTGERKELPNVWFSTADGFKTDAAGQISFHSANEKNKNNITIPVRMIPSPSLKTGWLAVPGDLAGKMNAARNQEAVYDPITGEFNPAGEEMRYFRAYARSIDELESLVDFIRGEGVKSADNALREPASRVEDIRNIRRLAGYMEQIYLLIVFVSGVSGIFAIAASVYAGVQRKRYDLAYLELLGVHPGALFLFPYLKSMMLVIGGVVFAFIAYLIFGHFSDRLFAHALGGAASLTRLTGQNVFFLVSGILIAGTLASLLAATSVMRIEPGEYIRE